MKTAGLPVWALTLLGLTGCAGSPLDLSTPKAAYRSYVKSVKADNLEDAKRCMVISDNNRSGVLDVIAGLQVSSHRLTMLALSRFGDKGIQFGREDCTDEAIDRTLSLIDKYECSIQGNKASLDPNIESKLRQPTFGFGGEEIALRKVGSSWRMDANKMTNIENAEDFFRPGSWGPAMRDYAAAMNSIIEGIEARKLRTVKQVAAEMHKIKRAADRKRDAEHRKHYNAIPSPQGSAEAGPPSAPAGPAAGK